MIKNKFLVLGLLFVCLLFSACGKNQISGRVTANNTPDFDSEVYLTKVDISSIIEFNDANRRFDLYWRIFEINGDKSDAEIVANITCDEYIEIMGRAYQTILEIKSGLFSNAETVSIKTTTDINGEYSIKFNGDNWNLVCLSNRLNRNGDITYVNIDTISDFTTTCNIKFETYNSNYFRY